MKKAILFMFYVMVALAIDLAVSQKVVAQDAATAVTAQTASVPVAATPVVVTPTPVVVSVPAPAAPPAWATDLLMTASGLPVVGPYITKGLMYLGILAALLTSMVAFLLGSVTALESLFTWAGLVSFATVLTNFKNGSFMWYLTYFSNFNAQKPQS